MLLPAASFPWDAKRGPEMRLSEFSAPAATNSESTLATLLQFLLSKADMPNIGDKSAKEIKIPTDTIIQLMKNQGLGFSYADLDAATKNSDLIKHMIKTMDPKTVTIKASPDEPNTDTEPGDERDVARMASRAAGKRI